MTEEINDLRNYILDRMLIWEYHKTLAAIGANISVSDPPTARGIVSTLGYDKAKRWGVLEVYKDAMAVNFNRPEDAWEKWNAALTP